MGTSDWLRLIVPIIIFAFLILIGIRPLIFPTEATRESIRQADEAWAAKQKINPF